MLFGIGDGGGYLLGTAFHWSVSDSVSSFIATTALTVLGLYWIAIAIYTRWAAKDPDSTRARWAVLILPWALSIDNITYGLVSGVPAHASVWTSAGVQALSSAVQAGIGILIAWGLVARFPGLSVKCRWPSRSVASPSSPRPALWSPSPLPSNAGNRAFP